MMATDTECWTDFTRANYRRLLRLAMNSYTLGTLAPFNAHAGTAFWRHDVDVSPQAALALASIEHEEGVAATYYFNLRSEFYNLLEQPNLQIGRRLAVMGHEIGLHFDAAQADLSSVAHLEHCLATERDILRDLLGVDVRSFSFHNPSEITAAFTEASYAGLRNAYGKDLMSRTAYCSDSNGYWRFTPLEQFLRAGHASVCVLTHPEWWQEEPLSPRDRIVRCVEGRAAATLRRYDASLQLYNRKNIR
jgi:hypothetical protein